MIEELLYASDALHGALADVMTLAPPLRNEQPRFVASSVSALLAVEHGTAARICFAAALTQSATAVIRLQFEATVRAAWLLYVATEEQIALVQRPLDDEADELARKLPAATAMLKALVARNVHEGLVSPLRQFYDVSWHPLNSYIHAGLHPLRRQSEGFPEVLACQLLRSSNALLHVTVRIMAALTGSTATMAAVTDLWKDHRGCLPMGPLA